MSGCGAVGVHGRRRRGRVFTLSITVSVPVAVALIPLATAIHEPVVVIGVLVIAFRRDSVARRVGVAREREVAVQYLLCGSPNLDIGAVAFDGLVSGRRVTFAVASWAPATRAESWFHGSYSPSVTLFNPIAGHTSFFARPVWPEPEDRFGDHGLGNGVQLRPATPSPLALLGLAGPKT